MHSILTFVMRGRVHVITACAVCSVLSLILFPLNYVSGALLGLAVLRNGGFEGALVLLGSAALGGAFMWATLDTARPILYLVLMSWAPIWAVALVLRNTHAQGLSVGVGAFIVGLSVTGLRLFLGDPTQWWTATLTEFMTLLDMPDEWERLAGEIAPYMTGVVASGLVLGIAVMLLLARCWHSILDHPGGFGEEFREFRLPTGVGYAMIAFAVIAWASEGAPAHLAFEWLMIYFIVYLLQGLSLVHLVVRWRNASVAWLAGLYVGLALIPQPSTMLAFGLAFIGFSDTWIDYRRRIGALGGGGGGGSGSGSGGQGPTDLERKE